MTVVYVIFVQVEVEHRYPYSLVGNLNAHVKCRSRTRELDCAVPDRFPYGQADNSLQWTDEKFRDFLKGVMVVH